MAGYATPVWTNDAAPAITAQALKNLGEAAELGEHPYGVCSTAAATAAKTVSIDFSGTLSLFAGLTVRVKFTNGNTAANPSLSINSTGAVSIAFAGSDAGINKWASGSIVDFCYDGTNWNVINIGIYKANQSQLAPVETSSTASQAYAVGDYFCYNGILYRVTVAIDSGGTITPGTNCAATNVGNDVSSLVQRFTFVGTAQQPTTNDITVLDSHHYLMLVQRTTNQIYLCGVVVTSAGNVSIATIAGTQSGSDFEVSSSAKRTVTVTAKNSGVVVLLFGTP